MALEIKAVDISYSYEGSSRNALNKISMKVGSGEKVILLGANGSGKTTLLKILCGLYKPQQGRIMIDGEVTAPSPSFNFRIGYVPENPLEMFFEATVEREIRFILKNKKEKQIESKVESIMEKFDLTKFRNRTPFELSSGERKKLSIAANIVANQEIVLLDEPVSDLDLDGVRMVEDFIKTSSCSILATSHRTDFARIFDRVVLINSGNIVNDNIDLNHDRKVLEEAKVMLLRRV